MKTGKNFSIAPEGAPFILPLLCFALILNMFGYIICSYIIGILGLGVILFFRDPGRKIPEGDNIIVSPADGKVIFIEDDAEDFFLHEKVTRVSIFLSVFNVHINRVPLAGVVKFFKNQTGVFVPAYRENAYLLNQQNIIGIENKKIRYLFRQITGLVARRVVFRGKIGDYYETGETFGLMKFGSRMDVYLPKNVKIKINKGDKVKAGVTIIGEIQ